MMACTESKPTGVFAPGVDPAAASVDGMIVGHRLMVAGEYELALGAFQRAAAETGLTGETLSAIGTANLKLDRLHQAETTLRRMPQKPNIWKPTKIFFTSACNVKGLTVLTCIVWLRVIDMSFRRLCWRMDMGMVW